MRAAIARTGGILILLAALPGCPREEEPAEVRPQTAGATREVTAAIGLTGDGGVPEAVHHSSRRCGECHKHQREQWKESAHATAASAPFVKAVEMLAPDQKAQCDACHVPLRNASARIAGEGVTCDACHTATGTAAPPGALALAPELATKFGPFRDSKDHNFHRVAYSEFVIGSELCNACHED